jgi:hypothetical protein
MQKTLLKGAVLLTGSVLSATAFADYITLNTSGPLVMSSCSPTPTCRVRILPGSNPGGYLLLAARKTPIVVNAVTVGKVLDRVWKKPFTNTYVFATRVILNDEDWGNGVPYEVDDIFRSGFSTTADVSAGWRNARVSDQPIDQAGRTSVGLNEGTKTFDLTTVNFYSPLFVQIAEEGGGDDDDDDDEEGSALIDEEDEDETAATGSPGKVRSAWYFVRTTASGFQLGANAVRLWNAGEGEGQEPRSLYFSGYLPTY